MLTLDRLVIEQGDFRLTADLRVEKGRIVAVLGPSGAGKSTLLDVIAGFLPPSAGRVLWQGKDLGPLAPGDRPLSMLFQDNNLFPHLTAAQNVGLGLRPDLRLSPKDWQAVEAALARVGLAGLGDRVPAALSGGQRGRVALARMLLRGRPLMLLDEPFAALGPALKSEMLALVANLARETGATVLLVTHDPQDARAIAEETVIVADGRTHPPRPTAALLADPPPALRAYLG
ncbi:thiamine ABC transporter ATP-binding protein [Rhodovulum marinum]|uniref:Thiamine transport system ATP-binding protein n=1 Tax=Rhodovulum marinum TaxID=320662 RepID=A0A4R2PV45_9RHOB|nr:thiamine ABC transporter ATP-binding protein [Rhodovulum marinum]TCP39787.1 thiamine transport system ATP-binding protein [Rhodovulum marinum]